MEGLALTGAWVDRDAGLLSTIVLEMGGSSDLCALLQPGEPVILMGPTGTPTETPGGETVLLVGGGLGNAVLFSIGQALRAQGSRVLYFAGYKRDRRPLQGRRDRARRRRHRLVLRRGAGLRAGAAAGPRLRRQHRRGDRGLWRRPARAESTFRLPSVDRIIAIGSDGMMAAVARGAPRRARRAISSPGTARSPRSTRRCSA